MLYPFKFKPIFKEYIWGGRNLAKLKKDMPEYNVAESWEIACLGEDTSVIANGELEGVTLDQALKKLGRDLIGTALPKMYVAKFPLIAKFIDANRDLSVQIHPFDNYGYRHEKGSWGKHEMFYVVSAEPGARIVCGVKPELSFEEIARLFKSGKAQECLNYLEVESGDVINVPPGVVHAVGKGMIIAEIEQNSNITYRIYDYDRTDDRGEKRPLQIEKALEVFDFEKNRQACISKGVKVRVDPYSHITYKVENKYFSVDEYCISGNIRENTMGKSFHIYMFLEGQGEIIYGSSAVILNQGETVMVPAALGDYTVQGDFKALKSYIPDIQQNIAMYLKNAGYIEEEIFD